MRLQLSKTQVKHSAAVAGKPSGDLAIDTLRVLAIFAQDGHDPCTRRDVTAVLRSMGANVEVWQTIDSTLKSNTTAAPGRGFRTQGEAVGVAAPLLSSQASVMDGVTVHSRAGLAWMPTPVKVDDAIVGYYKGDVGLRRLAIAGSKCFGAHSLTSKSCTACPLATWCARTAVASMAGIARLLDEETERSLLTAAETAREATKAESTTKSKPKSKAKAEEKGKAKPKSKAKPDAKDLPSDYAMVELPFDGQCSGCNSTIPTSEKAYHVVGIGMFHESCAREYASN